MADDGEDGDKPAPARMERASKRSFFDREVARRWHEIHKIKAKDTTGRWAYYLVLVPSYRERSFLAALYGEESLDLDKHGKVVDSCYGEGPTDEMRARVKERFGFDL